VEDSADAGQAGAGRLSADEARRCLYPVRNDGEDVQGSIETGTAIIVTTRRRQFRRAIQKLLDQYHATYDEHNPPLNDAIADAIISLLSNAKKKASKQTKKKHRKAKPITLRQLEKLPYRKYLETEHWQQKRLEALRAEGYKCHLCQGNNRELHVHHLTYIRLGHELPDDLMVLCKECHEKVHEEMNK